MTPSNDIPVSPELLESHFIIRTSPAWKEVAASRERLAGLRAEGAQAYEKMEVDRDNVLRYAATLERSADSIILGICLATHLSGFSSAQSPAQRLADGFQALSGGLDLRSLDETDTRAELDRCLRAAFPQLKIEPTPLHPADNPKALDSWRASLENAMQQCRSTYPADRLAAQRKAWESWQSRLLAYANRLPDVPPDIDYLRCRAEGSLPGTILRGRLKNLTVREWSEAYVAGIAAESTASAKTPMWFAFGALGGLGFDMARELAARSSTAWDETEAADQFLQKAAPANPRKGVIIVKLAADSLTANWRVSGVPALTVTAEEYLSQAKTNVQGYFQSRLHGILLEVDRTEQPADAQKRTDWARIQRPLPSVRLGFLMARPPDNASAIPTGATYTVAPSDAATAATQAFLVSATGAAAT